MDHMRKIRQRLDATGWFTHPGAYVMTDGQFGSTGKGVIAGALAEMFYPRVHVVASNAGPNSGHTSFLGDEKIVLKQLPTFGVIASKLAGRSPRTMAPEIYLTGGAVVDMDILKREMELLDSGDLVTVHPYAAVISDEAKGRDAQNVVNIASTGQGVGPAIINKLTRDPEAVFMGDSVRQMELARITFDGRVSFFEVSQGYSLGINSGFYPHVTTRECTVSQALADAGVSPALYRKSILSVRTYPIRVGNTQGSSGPAYPDQEEISWDVLGVEPEMTTVTKRVRRVFTWSNIQFREAVYANTPAVIFLNFCNYLQGDEEVDTFVRDNIIPAYIGAMGKMPEAVILGFGPRSSDLRLWEN